jgi:voltage-gated potassium channel
MTFAAFTKKYLSKFLLSVLLISSSIVIGTGYFYYFENYKGVNALYMAVITISTVGFTEVQALSDGGKIFVVIYILLNLGIFAYTISNITSFIFEGGLRKVFKNYMVERDIEKLSEHVIVCGYGRNGKKVCEELRRSGLPYVVIEQSQEQVLALHDKHSFCIQGDATQDELLLQAGIQRAATVIITLPRDADNVFITLTARELNPRIRIVARASEEKSEKKLYRAGADKVVLPDVLGGLHMAQIVTKPQVTEFLDLLSGVGQNVLHLEQVACQALKEAYRGQGIGALQARAVSEATILAVKSPSKGFLLNPRPDTLLSDEDILILLGMEQAIAQFKAHYLQT